MKIYEKDVVEQLIKYLKSQGVKDIFTEVFFLGALIDIVYIDDDRKFVCVEVKLNDWRTVIKQALKTQSFVPQCYVAMPLPETEYRRRKIQEEVKPTGLGLWWIIPDGRLGKAFKPKCEEYKDGKRVTWADRMGYYHLADSIYFHLNFTFLTRCIDYYKQKKDKKGHAYLF